MGVKQSISVDQLGGEWRAGDQSRIPRGKSVEVKNLFVRPGNRLEKRHPWTKTTNAPPAGSNTLMYDSGGNRVIALTTTAGSALASHSGGSWTTLGASYVTGSEGDYANLGSTMYATYKASASPNEWVYVSDDSASAGQKNLAGSSIASFIRRLFMANVTERIVNKLTPKQSYKFDEGWVRSSANISTLYNNLSENVIYSFLHVDTATANSQYLELTTGFTTTADTWVTYLQYLYPSIARTIPFGLEIRDTAGLLYGTFSSQITRTEPSTSLRRAMTFMQPFTVSGLVPAGKTVVIRVKIGDDTNGTVFDDGLYLAFQDSLGTLTNSGAQLTEGRYPFPFIASSWDGSSSTWPTVVNTYSDRLIWTEPDAPSHIRGTNYFDCKGVPGDLQAVRIGSGRVMAYKKRGVWSFRVNTDADIPIQFERTFEEFGCDNKKAIGVFENKHYFIDTTIGEVYEWDHVGAPTPLAGEGMREYLFNSSTRVTTPLLEVDPIKKEIYVYIRQHRIYVYSLERREWSYLTVTGASDAERAISDLLWDGSTMWALDSASGNAIRLDSTATQDNADGTARNVVATLVPRPLETAPPRKRIMLNFAWLRHKVSASQTGSTFRAEVSLDGGATYGPFNQLGISPLSSNGALVRMPVPLRQTSVCVFVKFKHDGLAGPDYFNVYGLEYDVNIRGIASPQGLPTQGSSDLL